MAGDLGDSGEVLARDGPSAVTDEQMAATGFWNWRSWSSTARTSIPPVPPSWWIVSVAAARTRGAGPGTVVPRSPDLGHRTCLTTIRRARTTEGGTHARSRSV